MKLRTRLAASFAIVALGTGGAVALAAPVIVQQGFQQLENVTGGTSSPGPTATPAPSATPRPSPSPSSSPGPGETMGPDHNATTAPSRTPTPTNHDHMTSPTSEPHHEGQGSSTWPGAQWSTTFDGSFADATPSGGLIGDGSEVILAIARPGGRLHEGAPVGVGSSTAPTVSPTGSGGLGGPVAAGPTDTAAATRATTIQIVLIALVAAVAASVIGLFAADRLVRPLRRLQAAASAVAAGDLAQRSGLADRTDEIGDLGRSFDTMAIALEVSESTRKRFLQDAVHELRTPITVIEATASAVIDGVYAAEPRHLETIRSQARLLSRIVDDLRTISLAEAGVLELRREPTEVASTLRRVAEGFRARAEASGITLGVEAPEAVVVDADPERLRQALGSLVDNAIRHTPAGGQITLAGSTAPAGIRLDVRDSGPGVAVEDLPHVFERFYQADPSRDRARGSSGLGLAIVKALAEAHGGTVGVENAAPGGADFWIRLPAV